MWDQEALNDLNESMQGGVTSGNSSKIPVGGEGDIMIQTKTGDRDYISDIYYVPGLLNNILKSWAILGKRL